MPDRVGTKSIAQALFVVTAALLSARATVVIPPLPAIPAAVIDVRQHGVVADGSTDNANALQALIDSVSKAGGGVIDFPAASQAYVSGPLVLASHIDLRVEAGARVEPLSYGTYPLPASATRYTDWLTSNGATDLAISGHGVIDGQGGPWWSAFNANSNMPHRPYLIHLSNTTRIHVHGLTLQNSPMFHLALSNDNEVTVDSATILAPADAPNTDAIDPSGVDYLITRDSLAVGDDNVAIKAGDAFCKNFTLTHLRCGTGHGISVGGQTNDGLDSLLVDSCTMTGTTNGLRLKANRTNGGLVQHLIYENIVMTGVQHPIYITSYYSETTDPTTDPAQPIVATTPFWKDILFKNITIAGGNMNSVEIYGVAEAPVDSVIFDSVSIQAKTGFIVDHTHDLVFFATTFNGQSSLAAMVSSQMDASMSLASSVNVNQPAGVRIFPLTGPGWDPLGRRLGRAAYGPASVYRIDGIDLSLKK